MSARRKPARGLLLFIFMGLEVGLLCSRSVCSFGLAQGTVFLLLGVFLSLGAYAFRLLAPAFRAAHPFSCILSGCIRSNACCAFSQLPFASAPVRCFRRPLSHLDNCTFGRRSVRLFPDHFFVSVLKSSPRPISIVKLHALPHFHRRPIAW